MDQTELMQMLIEQIRILNESNAAKDAQIAALTEQVARLTAQIEELTHKKNSNNSSKPPSEGRLDKPAPKSLRGKSEKKQGGQPGHKGTGMKVKREPDRVEEHIPEKCKINGLQMPPFRRETPGCFPGRYYRNQAIRCRSICLSKYSFDRRLRECGSDKAAAFLFADSDQYRSHPEYAG